MPFSQTKRRHTKAYWTRHFEGILKPVIEENPSLEARRSQGNSPCTERPDSCVCVSLANCRDELRCAHIYNAFVCQANFRNHGERQE
jgi:hypothetical protein